MKNKKYYLLLVVVISVFLFTRLYKITEIPSSLYWDEASIGYNAYAIATTFKDEWGSFLPVHFRAFGEFKLPVYIYSVSFLMRVFGMSDLMVRLPAVLFSLGTVLITFLLTFKITQNKAASILASFTLITMPWFFIFSRTGFEVSTGLMFYLLGVYLFLLNTKNWTFYIFSAISFLACLYSYNSFRVLIPLTLVFLFLFEVLENKTRFNKILIAVFIFVLFLGVGSIPILRLILFDNGANRLQTVGIFSHGSSAFEVIGNFLGNYLSHFDPRFLFIQGDSNPRLNLPGFGQLYWISIPFILLGLWKIWQKKGWYFLLPLVLLIAPIPAAITFESPHALRAFTMAPFFAVIIALGVLVTGDFFNTKKAIFYPVIISIFLVFFGVFLSHFISDYNNLASRDWQYAYKIIFTEYKDKFKDYNHIIVSDAEAQPYIFALYYLKYDPEKFRSSVTYNTLDRWGFSTVNVLDKMIFEPINPAKIPAGKTLIFASTKEKIERLTEKSVIKNIDGSNSFYIYEYQKN